MLVQHVVIATPNSLTFILYTLFTLFSLISHVDYLFYFVLGFRLSFWLFLLFLWPVLPYSIYIYIMIISLIIYVTIY